MGEPTGFEERLREADEALGEGEWERARERIEAEATAAEPDPDAAAVYGLALYFGGGEDPEPYLALALVSRPDDPELHYALGGLRAAALEFEEAERHLRAAVAGEPEWADAHFLLGRILEWRIGDEDAAREAEACFRRAAELDPEEFPLPQRLGESEFQAVLRAAIESLPDEIGRAAEEVAILVEPLPSRELLRSQGPGFGPELLGLYTGTPLPDRSHLDSGRPPDVIHVFQRNLEHVTRDTDELREEIRITLLHEVGHYLGMDEDDLESLGLE